MAGVTRPRGFTRRAAILLAGALPLGADALAHEQSNVADHIVVRKAARTLTLYDADGRILRAFRDIQLGPHPEGPKQFQGDGRTPEGDYVIDWGNERSSYHLALHVSYPGPADRAFAAAQGRDPGGLIMVHGQPNWLPGTSRGLRAPGDWTDGCIALSDREIEALWDLVGDGTPITIEP